MNKYSLVSGTTPFSSPQNVNPVERLWRQVQEIAVAKQTEAARSFGD
jgi:hypothetical protein